MKRPFAVLGFSLLFAGIFATFLDLSFFVFVFFLGVLYFFVLLKFEGFKKNLTAIISIFAVLFYLVVYFLRLNYLMESIKILGDKNLKIIGTVCDFPVKKNGNFYYIINVVSADILENDNIELNKIQNMNMKVFSKNELDVEPCDEITLKVKTFKHKGSSSLLDFKKSLAKGVCISSFVDSFDDDFAVLNIQKSKNLHFNFYFLKLRNEFSKIIKTLLPKKHAGIANSFLLGQKDDVDDNVKSLFVKTGMSHLLVVSGVHMSVVAQFFIMFFNVLKLNKRKSHFLGAFFVLIFMALTGFATSVIRSGIMCIVYMLGVSLHKKSDSLNSLGISVFVLILLNPFVAADVGFLLSVFATLGIILFSKKINLFINDYFKRFKILKIYKKRCSKFVFEDGGKKIKVVECDENFNEFSKKKLLIISIKNKLNFKKFFDEISSLLAVSLGAVVLNFPIMFFVFKKFSFSFLISNILVSFTVVFIMIASLLAAVFGAFSIIFVAKFFALFSGIFINYILFCANFVRCLSFLDLEFKNFSLAIFFAFVTLFLVLGTTIKTNKLANKLIGFISIFALFVFLFNYSSPSDSIKLNVTNTNDGAILTLIKNEKIALLSCSGKELFVKDLINYENDCVDLITLPEISPKILDFLDNSNLKNANVIFAPKTKNTLDVENIKYFSKNIDVHLWENVRIESVKKNKKVWTRVTINEISILLCPKKSDLLETPSNFLECSFVFSCEIPKNLENSKSQYVLISCDFNKLNANNKKICKLGKMPLFATANSSINIEFLKNNKILF